MAEIEKIMGTINCIFVSIFIVPCCLQEYKKSE